MQKSIYCYHSVCAMTTLRYFIVNTHFSLICACWCHQDCRCQLPTQNAILAVRPRACPAHGMGGGLAERLVASWPWPWILSTIHQLQWTISPNWYFLSLSILKYEPFCAWAFLWPRDLDLKTNLQVFATCAITSALDFSLWSTGAMGKRSMDEQKNTKVKAE